MIAGLILIIILAAAYWLFISPQSQAFGRFVWRGQTEKKLVALTFDDGPNEPYTSQIADYLHTEAIAATFFVVGANIDRYPGVVKKLVEQGHIVGNHSYHHQFRKYFTSSDYGPELMANQARITKDARVVPALFRPPWLYRTPLILKRAQREGYMAISGVFCHVFEIFQPKAERIAARALAKVKPGTILIFHDGFNARPANRTQTYEAIKLLVPMLKQRGYKFVTVDKLLSINPYQKESK